MQSNHTEVIEYWGFECYKGGKFYICENSWAEFFGCCTTNPCADGTGVCRPDHLRPFSFNSSKHSEIPSQDCLASSVDQDFYVCHNISPSFMGCCSTNACDSNSGCSSLGLGMAGLYRSDQRRLDLLYQVLPYADRPGVEGLPHYGAILEPVSTIPDVPFASPFSEIPIKNTALMEPRAMAGVYAFSVLAALLCIWIVAIKCNGPPSKTKHNNPTYVPIIDQEATENSESSDTASTHTADDSYSARLASVCKPRDLKQPKLTALMGWTWSFVLTLLPGCFIGLAVAAMGLDGRIKSGYTEDVFELTRLGPSLYPILFAAIAGRFYRNLARWRLEQPGGVGLAVLEQVFGSQSFATALERIFTIHANFFLSVLIISSWALSPLGGQSSSRVVSFGNATERSNGTVSYVHPAYQVSSSISRESLLNARRNIQALYSSSLLSSIEQRLSPRDMWDLPKIPQWNSDKKIGETYLVDRGDAGNGNRDYASLLGIKLHGLDLSVGMTEYEFTVQTSYIDLQCSVENAKPNISYIFGDDDTLRHSTDQTVIADIKSPISWSEWKSHDRPPPLHLLYLGKWKRVNVDGLSQNVWSAINCTMQVIWLETRMHCGPSPLARGCYAKKQRRVTDGTSPNRLPRLMTQNHVALRQAIFLWSEMSSEWNVKRPSATENYIMNRTHPFGEQDLIHWTEMDPKMFPANISRRFTTAFNTFWDATLNPLGHTQVSFDRRKNTGGYYEGKFNGRPFLNLTTGTMTANKEVYRVSLSWLTILVATTLFLQILAILGLVLEVFTEGPDVLGYASSLTRDNPYVPLPGGSGLGGPERARTLRNLRLQLADVRPDDNMGYLAVRALPSKAVEQVIGQDLTERTNADEALKKGVLRRMDTTRLYI